MNPVEHYSGKRVFCCQQKESGTTKLTSPLVVEGILFDFDGTLFDTIGLIIDCYQYTYRTHGLREHSVSEILSGIGLPLEQVLGEYGDQMPQLLATFQDRNRQVGSRSIGIFRGIGPMLDTLKEEEIPVGIVTAKRASSIWETLKQFQMEKVFQCVVTKDDTEKHKPDPEPIFCGMEKLGISDPLRVLYVGDSVHDLRAAHRAKCLSGAVGWSVMPHSDLRAENPTIWIETPLQLPKLVRLFS